MTHFRPIRVVPITILNTTYKIVDVPPIRQKTPRKDAPKAFKPIKTKFKKKLTSIHRRSAFSIFQPLKSANAVNRTIETDTCLDIKTVPVEKNLSKNNIPSRKMTESVKSEQKLIETNNCTDNGRIRTRNQQKKTKALQYNSIQNATVVVTADSIKNVNNCAKLRLQEKEDLRLAKMLQEYNDNTQSTPSNNRTMRYHLRSRSKPSISSLSSSSAQEFYHNKKYLVAQNNGGHRPPVS